MMTQSSALAVVADAATRETRTVAPSGTERATDAISDCSEWRARTGSTRTTASSSPVGGNDHRMRVGRDAAGDGVGDERRGVDSARGQRGLAALEAGDGAQVGGEGARSCSQDLAAAVTALRCASVSGPSRSLVSILR